MINKIIIACGFTLIVTAITENLSKPNTKIAKFIWDKSKDYIK